jgi:tetratricopeptide (TPR) repeat protein
MGRGHGPIDPAQGPTRFLALTLVSTTGEGFTVGFRARLAIGAAAAGLMLGAGVAQADRLTDCKEARVGEVRIAACSEVIDAAATAPAARLEAYRARAAAYAERAAHKEAISDYSEALRLKTDDGASFYGRGQARLALNQADGAIDDFTQAIRHMGEQPGLYVARGYAQLVKDNANESIADFTVAIRLAPKNASALNNRGLAWRKKGDLDNAIKDYTAAIALNPSYAIAYNNRGYVFEAKGDKQAAAADFRRALSLDPSLVGARNGLKRIGEPVIVSAESDKLIAEGRLLAERNCAWCHAIGKSGDSPNPRAPAWRDLYKRHPILALREPLTRGIARPHDEMPKFELTDAEVDTIVAYINSLAP